MATRQRQVTLPGQGTSGGRRQGGLGLIEVLIAVLVLAVGLLGLASLQAFGLRNNQSAYNRTLATLQAYDLTDRMRANMTGAESGDYVFTTGYGGALPATDCVANVCPDAGDMADHDIREWMTANSTRLPDGWGRVTQNGDLYTITVMWNDQRLDFGGDDPGTNCAGPADENLTCFTITFQP